MSAPLRVLAASAIVVSGTLLGTIGVSGQALTANAHKERPKGVTLDPLFKLVDHDGRPFSRNDMRGRPTIVVFGYTNCPEVCPTTLFDLTMLLERLGAEADRVRVLFVTVDPDRDTVGHLKNYMQSFDRRITALTGSVADIAAVAAAFGAPFQRGDAREAGYGMEHSSMTFMLDRFGMLARMVPYNDSTLLASTSQRLLAQ